MVTKKDLDWWIQTAPSLEWIWARTYADFAPHWYLPRERTRLSLEDYHRALKVLWTFGVPKKFHRRTNLELVDPVTNRKWFDTSHRLEDSLINMAEAHHFYGEQDAPDTRAPFTEYDKIAADYDPRYAHDVCEVCAHEEAEMWRIITAAPLHGNRRPDYLDVGCGTGLLLDMRLVPHGRTDLYRGVDPSQGMLNRLVVKHPWAKDLHPVPLSHYLASDDGRVFDTAVALFGAASYLDADLLEPLVQRTSRQTILMHYVDGYWPDYYDTLSMVKPAGASESRQRAAELAKERGGQVLTLTEYQVTVIPDGP